MFSSFLSKLFAEARQDESVLASLKALDHVVYSGLPLSADDQDWAREKELPLINVFACTEAGVTMQSDDFKTAGLKPIAGTAYEFMPVSGSAASQEELLELVVLPASKDCPHPSLLSPETGKFHTGDLFVETRLGVYLARGRNDDWIKMENAMRCNTFEIEENAMQTCSGDLIDAAVVVGAGRPNPVLIVESKQGGGDSHLEDEAIDLRSEILGRILPFHARRYVHERIDHVSLVLVAPNGSLARTATKGNIRRRMVEDKYKPELDRIFKVGA
jgi:acyl-coenzyme A synthetase/AMP-(fatty) acid ligase